MQCEHLIWTSSLGYLKENFHSVFANESALIAQKQDAIANLGFDTVNKVNYIRSHIGGDQASFRSCSSTTTDSGQRTSARLFCCTLLTRCQPMTWHLSRTKASSLTYWRPLFNRFIGTMSYPRQTFPFLSVGLVVQLPSSWKTWAKHRSVEFVMEFCASLWISRLIHIYLDGCSSNSNLIIDQTSFILFRSDWHRNRFTRGSYTYYSVQSSSKHGEQLRTAYAPDGVCSADSLKSQSSATSPRRHNREIELMKFLVSSIDFHLWWATRCFLFF